MEVSSSAGYTADELNCPRVTHSLMISNKIAIPCQLSKITPKTYLFFSYAKRLRLSAATRHASLLLFRLLGVENVVFLLHYILIS